MRRATALVIALSLAGAACQRMNDKFRPLAVGEPVPLYATRTLGGDSARVGPSEPLTLLHVWATWCLPCQAEFPDLQKLHEEFGPKGLRILAVSVDSRGDDAVLAFVKEKGATFTIGRDEESAVRTLYQSIGVPETYLISPDGKLLWRTIGALRSGGAEAREVIAKALSSPASGND
jgi:thiol-disulfide isomerase/thioredoxin